ncbi:hypothetical protein OBBRIDRAFT_220813 [Obba rivulosa]|uniref:Uncharacterized protein n=1 Tax=Obba rivulosa TaxID=1052685 RepID=A0A8E2AL06_9APHY|nr:hypothetical protein OBBRIDRAFT_220813 [Obba rivulosa]
MPPSLRVPLNREDVIAHSIFVLETFKEISGTIGSVPFLGAVIGSALSLIKTIDAVKTDKERRVRLVRRVSKLLQDIQEAVAANPDVSDGNLLANLAVLQSTLTSIQVDLEALIGKSALSRWVHRGALAAKLDEHIGTVDEASRSFIRALLMSLSRKGDDHTRSLGALVRDVGEQAQYDKNQVVTLHFDASAGNGSVRTFPEKNGKASGKGGR